MEGGGGLENGLESSPPLSTQFSPRLGHVAMFALPGVSVMVSLAAGWVAATKPRETESDGS